MNLAQVLTRVSANVLGIGQSQVEHNIEAYVQAAALQLQLLHNFRVMAAEQHYITPTQSPQTHILGAIPSGWKAPRGNPYYVLYIGSTKGLTWQPEREYLYRKWNPTDVNQIGAPRDLFLGEPIIGLSAGDVNPAPDLLNPDYGLTNMPIEVYPFPDGSSDWSDGKYRINVPYWAYIPLPVKETDTNWFLVNAIEFLVAAATSACFEQAEEYPQAQYWMKKAWGPRWDGASVSTLGGSAKQTINLDCGIQGMPSKTLTPRQDVYGPRDQWRQ